MEKPKQKDIIFPFESGLHLEVNFDYYTARRHFIIVERDESKKKAFGFLVNSDKFPKNHQLDDDAETQVYNCYVALKAKIGKYFSRFTLVTHHGTYVSKKSKGFHAHIWVDNEGTDQYAELLKANSALVEENLLERLKPMAKYLEKMNKYSDEQKSQQKTWMEKDDVKPVQEALQKGEEMTLKNKPKNFELVYHESLPCIGWKKKGEEDVVNKETWLAMKHFARINKMTGKEDSCHVCLGGQPNGTKFKEEYGDVQAYILASPLTYCKILIKECGREAATEWWGNYRNEINNGISPILS